MKVPASIAVGVFRGSTTFAEQRRSMVNAARDAACAVFFCA